MPPPTLAEVLSDEIENCPAHLWSALVSKWATVCPALRNLGHDAVIDGVLLQGSFRMTARADPSVFLQGTHGQRWTAVYSTFLVRDGVADDPSYAMTPSVLGSRLQDVDTAWATGLTLVESSGFVLPLVFASSAPVLAVGEAAPRGWSRRTLAFRWTKTWNAAEATPRLVSLDAPVTLLFLTRDPDKPCVLRV